MNGARILDDPAREFSVKSLHPMVGRVASDAVGRSSTKIELALRDSLDLEIERVVAVTVLRYRLDALAANSVVHKSNRNRGSGTSNARSADAR